MTVFRSSRGATAALMLATALGASAPASAVPLDMPACEQLQGQLDKLRSEGASADMARGPEWARANLPPDRLQRIATLLDVEEQLNFRCGKARIILPTTIEGGEEEIPGPGEATIEGTTTTIALPQKAPPAPGRPPATPATMVPKAPAPKAPATKAPATKPPPKRQPVKAAPPKKAPGSAVEPGTEPPAPKKNAPAKKKQPQADDAYRPPRPITSEGGWAPVVRQ